MAERYGKYELLERIASGGMAEVFKARLVGAAGFRKYVAIKRLHQHLAEDEEMVKMLMDEARLASMMSHPNVCQVLDFGYQDGTYYIAMEYIDGKDLSSMMKRAKRMGEKIPLNIALYIIREVLTGLDHAHRLRDPDTGEPLNIIHRDVSPQNVMITWDGTVKVIDFGIAKAEQALHSTQAGVIKGKFRYMAPEQAMGLAMDHRVDIFAVGVMLYELILGESHAKQLSDTQMLYKMQRADFTPIDQLVPGLPPELAAAVMKALARNPNERFPSARTFRKALERVVHQYALESGAEELSQYLEMLFPGRHASKSRVDLMEQSTYQLQGSDVHTVNARPQQGDLPPPPKYDYLTPPPQQVPSQPQGAPQPAAPVPAGMDIAAILNEPPPPHEEVQEAPPVPSSEPQKSSSQPAKGAGEEAQKGPSRGAAVAKKVGKGLLSLLDTLFSIFLVGIAAYGVWYFVVNMEDDPGVIEKVKERPAGREEKRGCPKENLGTVLVRVMSSPKGAEIFVNGRRLGVKTPAVFGLEMCKTEPTIFRAELGSKAVDIKVDKFPLTGELDLYFDLKGKGSRATERRRGTIRKGRRYHSYKYVRKRNRSSRNESRDEVEGAPREITFGPGTQPAMAAGGDEEDHGAEPMGPEVEKPSGAAVLPKGLVEVRCSEACYVYINGLRQGGLLVGKRVYRLVAKDRPYEFKVKFLSQKLPQRRFVKVEEGKRKVLEFRPITGGDDEDDE